MKTRQFGRTNLQVSEIIFGGGAVGGIVIRKDDDTKRQAIRKALDGGINWIDTAALYGSGKSEEALGWLLPEVPENPFISTKFNVDASQPDSIPEQIEASLKASLGRLKRASVDLFQLHNRISHEAGGDRGITVDQVLGEGGVADTLERLRKQGYFRYQGITALGDTPCIREVIRSGRFDSAQVYHNLLNPSAAMDMPAAWTGQNFGGIIADCKANGVAIMNIRVFAASVIASEERTGREGILTQDTVLDEEVRKARAVFEALGGKYGNRAQVALRFALGNPDISCVIIGIAELSHIDDALAACAMGPLPQEALDTLNELYKTDFRRN